MLQMYCDVVASVASGCEAVDAASRLKPDVIVVDLMMSDINGLEVCRRVKRLMPETAVIIMTADDDTAVRAAAFREGASAFVPKHSVAQTLGPTIERVFAEVRRPS